MKTKRMKMTVGFKRSTEFQSVNYELTDEFVLEDGDDRQQAIDTIRLDLASQVDDFCERALRRSVELARDKTRTTK